MVVFKRAYFNTDKNHKINHRHNDHFVSTVRKRKEFFCLPNGKEYLYRFNQDHADDGSDQPKIFNQNDAHYDLNDRCDPKYLR